MAKITDRDSLKEYIHSRLGAPCVSTADLTDEQLDFIIDHTLNRFHEQAVGFSQEERILYVPVEKQVAIVDISDVELQPTAAVEVIYNEGDRNTNIWSNLNTLFTVENMMIHKFGFNLNSPDMLTFQMTYDWMDFFTMMYSKQYQVEINEFGRYAKITPPPDHSGGMFIAVYVRRPEVELFNYSWVQNYAYGKALIQIGMNRSRFTGVTLPGGGTSNAEMYINMGTVIIEKLEEELHSEWTEPTNFYMG
ncbi:hypothetical protein DRO61_09520 [Candidatus Bathyarchaeota archaeon]|nr:MAG: hypothetical protein DRO61_09520 [Candidatus Bathyarchaeota archaeon]